jgi:hypothetical protein
VRDVDALFVDDIHLSDAGNYFVACVHFAALYRRSPEGLSGALTDAWGAPYEPLQDDTARALQRIAWETFDAYAPR